MNTKNESSFNQNDSTQSPKADQRKSLRLDKETLRALTSQELKSVVGGCPSEPFTSCSYLCTL